VHTSPVAGTQDKRHLRDDVIRCIMWMEMVHADAVMFLTRKRERVPPVRLQGSYLWVRYEANVYHRRFVMT
jgi:hypothetical protein